MAQFNPDSFTCSMLMLQPTRNLSRSSTLQFTSRAANNVQTYFNAISKFSRFSFVTVGESNFYNEMSTFLQALIVRTFAP